MNGLEEFWNRLNILTNTGWGVFWIAVGLLVLVAIFGRRNN